MGKDLKYTVIGAGNGGKAMSAHLAIMGFETVLYNRTYANIEMIAARGGIELESYDGGPRGFGKMAMVTDDIQKAVEHADIIMVVIPASGHADITRAMAPHLKDGQIIILNPGRTCGAIEVDYTLHKEGCTAEVIVAEAATFLYASRSDGPAQARIFRIKEALTLAALPSIHNDVVLDSLREAFPQFIASENVLDTGINNMGAIFHPALTILNSGWIESTRGDFQFYIDGVTPSVARVLEALDRERVTVASSLGIRARTAMEWLKLAYDASGENLNEAIHNQSGYYGITAPKSLSHRYLFEDVPMSLVPIAALGQRYGVSVRGMDSMIRLACIIDRTDYWRKGRTLEKLGIANWSVGELTEYVNKGVRPSY